MSGIEIIHDSHNLEYRVPFGAVKVGTNVTVRLWTSEKCLVFINLINFYNNQQEIKMEQVDRNIQDYGYTYEVNIDTKDCRGLLYYFFKVIINGQEVIYGNNIEFVGGRGQIYLNNPVSYQITIYDQCEVPDWYKEGIIYQIFVDRFYNGNEDGKILNPKKNTFIYGNWYDKPMYIKDSQGSIARWDFYGGNLLGVMKKLDYIKSLGVNIIYFNPIFDSPSCHKYDTGDYEKIDQMFGDEEVFKELCSKAEKLGIKVILDGVISHTGSDSKYFKKLGNYDSLGAYQSLQSPYYRWYRFNDYPNIYESWWGFSNMPNVDELNPGYIDYIIKRDGSIIEKWIRNGASGWRLDVADELPDEFIKLLKDKLRSVKKDSVLIGEVWEDASNKISYSRKREYLFGKELDSVTNYPLRQIILDLVRKYIGIGYFIKKYKSLMENYPKEYFYSTMNILGNHDTERVLTMLGNNIELLRIAVTIQMTLPGVPLIYYGDEAGLAGGKDPDNRKSFPWDRENKDIQKIYKDISRIRSTENSLKKGDIIFKEININTLYYERSYLNETVIIMINLVEKSEKCILKENSTLMNLIDNDEIYKSSNGIIEIKLKSHECKVLKKV